MFSQGTLFSDQPPSHTESTTALAEEKQTTPQAGRTLVESSCCFSGMHNKEIQDPGQRS